MGLSDDGVVFVVVVGQMVSIRDCSTTHRKSNSSTLLFPFIFRYSNF
mgnify:CR=1 FL=1